MLGVEPNAGPLGLIAGAGELPVVTARNARQAGRRLAVVGLRGWADPALAGLADRFRWAGVARVGAWIRFLRAAGCREAVMVGRVRKADMFLTQRWRQWLQYVPDWTSVKIWCWQTRDKRNDTLLAAVADALRRGGVELMDSTLYCAECMAEPGWLTPGGVRPYEAAPRRVRDDAAFGWPILREVARLDIGQAIAVKEREVIAVEAIEGTDRLIERAGKLCPAGGWVLLKSAKPAQDMRFDVPTVGPQTIENLHRARAAALVVEAGKTIILERETTLKRAAELGITVLGLEERG